MSHCLLIARVSLLPEVDIAPSLVVTNLPLDGGLIVRNWAADLAEIYCRQRSSTC
jgi:hypothetical protein